MFVTFVYDEIKLIRLMIRLLFLLLLFYKMNIKLIIYDNTGNSSDTKNKIVLMKHDYSII